jgi:hypothetical protein
MHLAIFLIVCFYKGFAWGADESQNQLVISPAGPLVFVQGATIVLNCSAPGRMHSDIQWLRRMLPTGSALHGLTNVNSGNFLPGNGRAKYFWVDRFVLQLVISNVITTDSGLYLCVSHGLAAVRSISVTIHSNIVFPYMRPEDAVSQCRHFTCHSTRHCIFLRYRCDHYVNCPDASDEIGCDPGCQSGFQCVRGTSCINASLVCDGHRHCEDGSDESFCRLSGLESGSVAEVDDVDVDMALFTTHIPRSSIHGVWHFNALYSGIAAVIGLLCVIIIVLIAFCRFHRQAMGLSSGTTHHLHHYHHHRRRFLSPGEAGVVCDDSIIGRAAAAAVIVSPPPYCEAAPPPYSTLDRPHIPPPSPLSDASQVPPMEDSMFSAEGSKSVNCSGGDRVEFSRVSECDDLLQRPSLSNL